MRNTTTQMDEVLEAVWTSCEDGDATLARVRAAAVGELTPELLSKMQERRLISVDGSEDSARITLTAEGRSIAERIMRSHRLAERLVCDVLGASVAGAEAAACEFEHTVSRELTDSICTLLGHPRFCPHGKAIPEGECCRQARSSVGPVVVPSTQLDIGEQGCVAYVAAANHKLTHQLSSLGLTPGVPVRLFQRWPSFVLKCEETEIALEESIASSIYIRREGR